MAQSSKKELASRINYLLAMGAAQIFAFAMLAFFGKGLYENAVSWNRDYPNHLMNTWMPLALYRGCEGFLVGVTLNVIRGIALRIKVGRIAEASNQPDIEQFALGISDVIYHSPFLVNTEDKLHSFLVERLMTFHSKFEAPAAPVAVPAEPRRTGKTPNLSASTEESVQRHEVKLVCGNGHEINAKHIAEFARACTPKEVNTLAESGNNVYLARELLATRKRLAEVTDPAPAPLPPPQEPQSAIVTEGMMQNNRAGETRTEAQWPEREDLDWPEGAEFTFFDEPGEHDPCYVVMPGGASLPLNHHQRPGVDIARATFIIDACNEKLRASSRIAQLEQENTKLRSQAEGQCDGCGANLEDAYCTKCKMTAEAALTQAQQEIKELSALPSQPTAPQS